MRTEKIHRKYPENNWNYKAISTTVNDSGRERNIIYYNLIRGDKFKEGIEVYASSNYIVNSKDRSYSRSYTPENMPSKYREIVERLKSIHKESKWSTLDYVNEN